MCQSLADGGRRCPKHQYATKALITTCEEVFGLTDAQVMHTFQRMRHLAPPSDNTPVSREEYNRLIERTSRYVSHNVENERIKNSILSKLNRELTDSQLPDKATLYSLKKMIPRCREQKATFVSAIREYAYNKGISRREAYQRYRELSARRNILAESVSYSNTLDGQTRAILTIMNDDPINHDVISSERRITLSPPDALGRSYGYDPDDGRFEISIDGSIYAYHNVTPAQAEEFSSGSLRAAFNTLSNSNFNAYDSFEEAERDAYGRWCRDCHSYRAASGHICEPTETQENSESVEEPANSEPGQAQETEAEINLGTNSVEDATNRIREALADQENTTNLPQRPRPRMTARRRLWVSPLESRETLALLDNNCTFQTSQTSGSYVVPSPDIVRAQAREGKIVEVNLIRSTVSHSYANDFGAPPHVNITQPLKFYCDDITGDVKMEIASDPRCDCLEYQRNYTCRHIRSSSGRINGYLTRNITSYYKKVDSLAIARQQAANGQYNPLRATGGTAYPTNSIDISCVQPTSNAIAYSRRILEDGGRIVITYDTINQWQLAEGTLELEGNSDNLGITVNNTLRCNRCDTSPCEHGVILGNYYQELLTPRNAVIDSSGSRLERLNQIEQTDWQANPEAVSENMARVAVGIDRSYTANLDNYLSDFREARRKVINGEDPLPFTTEPVTNGICAPGAKAFGIEIEFDLDNVRNRSSALQNIAHDMYVEGLTPNDYMERWHYNARTRNPYSTWSLESDSTVAGEIVSPILHDTPETWEQVKKICDIVKRYGGTASTRAGQHVHMGTVNRTGRTPSANTLAAKNAKILALYAANEDAIRRVQTDPARKHHRNTSYCSPLSDNNIRNNLYDFRNGYVNLGSNHSTSVNFGFDDRVEFRGADASLNPAHIQAQVMMCASLVAAAERDTSPIEDVITSIKHQFVGTNARKLEAIKLNPQAELSDDELIVSDNSYRNFITSLFPTEYGRKMMVAIAANTPWQR